jgi:hypothetical protein
MAHKLLDTPVDDICPKRKMIVMDSELPLSAAFTVFLLKEYANVRSTW